MVGKIPRILNCSTVKQPFAGGQDLILFALFPIWAGKKTILFPESFYRPLFIFGHSKMKSVTEKGLGKVGSVFVALRRDKGASKYNEADVSAFPQKVFPLRPNSFHPFYQPLSETEL